MLPAILVACSFFAAAQKDESTPPPPPPPEPPKVVMALFQPPVTDEVTADFYKLNKNVSNLSWQEGHIVIVTLKDNSKEKYDLNDSNQKNAFKNKYGECPPMPPPPPPPAPPKVKAVKNPPPPVPPKIS